MTVVNPDSIARINVKDSERSKLFKVKQYFYKYCFKKYKEPKYGIVCVSHAHDRYQSIDEFFEHPNAKEAYFKPEIDFPIYNGENVWLIIKPCVYIELTNGENYTKYFDSEEERDNWLTKTGLDKLIEKFIKIYK